jgi:hypothetical protein
MVASAVAAAAPPHPPFKGHTHNKVSPKTFSKAADKMIFNGVTESFVAMNKDKHMLCANAAHDIAPLQWMYDVAEVLRCGSTFNFDKRLGVKKA